MIIAVSSGLETFEPSNEITALIYIKDEPEELQPVSSNQKEANSNLTTIFPVKNTSGITYVTRLSS